MEILKKLTQSLDDLESAVNNARTVLENKPNTPLFIFDRLDNYADMLKKQRQYRDRLVHQIRSGHTEDIHQTIKLINGLSEFIKNDAKEILSTIKG